LLFPIRDDTPTYNRPYVTIGLIVINTVVFLYSQTLGYKGFQELLAGLGYTPWYFFGPVHYNLPTWMYFTPITSMFLHGGWMHLIGNMVFLWIYGNNIEDYFGPVKFLLFYLVSGIAAIGLYTLFNPSSQIPLVGASGAISGVMGAYMVRHPRAQITCLLFFFFITFVTLPAKIVLGLWFLYQIIMSFVNSSSGGGVAFLAHVGGFVFGWLVIKLIYKIKGSGGAPSGRQQVYRMQW
jgi:membrane associated rhomboid family serine protease